VITNTGSSVNNGMVFYSNGQAGFGQQLVLMAPALMNPAGLNGQVVLGAVPVDGSGGFIILN